MDLVREASERFGGHPALVMPEGRLSFAEGDLQSALIAAALTSLGIGQGDVVALAAPNGPEALLLMMALLRIGAVAAPVNHRFTPAHVGGMLDRLRPKLTVYDPDACPGLTVERAITFETLDEVKHAAASTTFTAADDPDRPASVIHTSASSGRPKAAMHSLSNHWHNAMGSAANLPFAPGDCWLLSLPIYHVGGYSMLFRCLLGGGALALPPAGASLEESLSQLPVTHLSLVPTQLYRMLRAPGGAVTLRRLKAILLGGSAAGRALLEEAVEAGLPIHLTYGSTEMGSQVSTSPHPLDAVSDDSGTLLPYREAAIAPDGEILVKGPCLFMGYLRHDGLDPARDGDGWLHTGDIGSLSDEGRLTVLGRRDNMFISGGENIHPEEIEQALASLPGIEEALVVPIRDREYGERPMAWVKVSKKGGPDDTAIAKMAGAALGGLKRPVAFRRVDKWVTIAGSAKIDREWYRKKVMNYE
ncbi:MAG: o-succinylbenzoate--CoA ligase [Chlorobiaceae bacterium]|nr:o-succinylbenzoate--CoA ligase [Chlorobiaceae bacterium]